MPMKRTIYTVTISTPLGNIIACASESGIVMILFEKEANLLINDSQYTKDWVILESKNEWLLKLKSQLKGYFEGTIKEFIIKIDFQGTPFQQRVWDIVCHIPYGTTCTYKEIANRLDNRKGIRAVAAANARNTILFVVPCHRVIGTGNKLTGYKGGIENKRWLIEHERIHLENRSGYQLF